MMVLFEKKCPVIGMLHVAALPGTPAYSGAMPRIIDQAVNEAQLYQAAGIDALMIENIHDTPYLNRNVGPEITAAMSVVGHSVKQATKLPTGIQILAGANREALAAALSAGLDFIRAEGFVFAHVADEGTMNSDAGELLRYRRQIGADHIAIFTDIKKKHSSHQLTADVDIVETAQAAQFFRSDGLVVTGQSTGQAAVVDDVKTVRLAVDIPVLVGSGVTSDNVDQYLPLCDGMIVGSHFKKEGQWYNPVDKDRVTKFIARVKNWSGA